MAGFAELQTDLPEWLEDDSTEHVAALPRIISLGQQRMFRMAFDLPCYRVETPLTGVLVVGNPNITLTDTPRKIRSVVVTSADTDYFVSKRTESYLRKYWPAVTATASIPKYYAQTQPNKLRLAGTPASALAYSLYYAAPLAELTNLAPTNWLTENAYDILLQCCLAESAAFLRMPQALATYEAKAAALWEQMKKEQGWNKFHEYNAGEE